MISWLNRLSADELAQIAKQGYAKSITVIVHPNFQGHNPKLRKYFFGRDGRQGITIIMDRKNNLDELVTAHRLAANASRILLVPTREPTDPLPEGGWQRFIKKLEIIAGKNAKIVVGGMFVKNTRLDALQSEISISKESAGTLRELSRQIRPRGRIENVQLDAFVQSSSNRRAARAFLQSKNLKHGPVWGCVGVAAAKLAATKKFNVNITRRLG